MKIFNRGDDGFVLLETLVALIEILVVIVGILSVCKSFQKQSEVLETRTQLLIQLQNEVK